MTTNVILRLSAILLAAGLSFFSLCGETLQLLYLSDLHYGITRTFRGHDQVAAAKVNRAMIEEINRLHDVTFPSDGGVGSGQPVGPMDYVVITGDIANRAQQGIQSATASWRQFARDWLPGGLLKVTNDKGKPAPLLLALGNHEASNAIGHYKVMSRDSRPCEEIYNMMVRPQVPVTTANYDYRRNRTHYSLTAKGIHLAFPQLWLDSIERQWLDSDLRASGQLPTLLFMHDQPQAVTRHFINPNTPHDVNSHDRFENLLSDTCSVTSVDEKPVKEYRQLEQFLERHGAVKAWFHGHENFTEFYRWKGPDGAVNLPVFRVDSPMKGKYSSVDDKRLALLVVSIDTESLRLTAREYLWNAGGAPHTGRWGSTCTISLK